MQRLEGFLSGQCGLSRKQWKERIRAGRVTCNGAPVLDPARQIDPARDAICIDGEALTCPQRVVLLLHKPAGYLTATQDRQDKTVMDLLPPAYATLGLRPVGRLDKQTEGLLLLTNDGALLHRLISPATPLQSAITPSMMARRRNLTSLPSPRGSPYATARVAARQRFALWALAAPRSSCRRENTTRCAGCWPPGACR